MKNMRNRKIALGILLVVLISSCSLQDKEKWKEKIHVRTSEVEGVEIVEDPEVPENTEVVEHNIENANNDVYEMVEEMPEFPGGTEALMQYITGAIKYPVSSQEKGAQGRVAVTFIVSKEGDVTNAEIIRGVDDALDEEALRIVNAMPRWKPGRDKGENVNVRFTLPIRFHLTK